MQVRCISKPQRILTFIGRPNTLTFGAKSGGYSTANGNFRLNDGATFLITVANDVNRNGRMYDAEIIPDVQVKGDVDDNAILPDEVLQWLQNEPACSLLK